jgi:hypothetical protein
MTRRTGNAVQRDSLQRCQFIVENQHQPKWLFACMFHGPPRQFILHFTDSNGRLAQGGRVNL